MLENEHFKNPNNKPTFLTSLLVINILIVKKWVQPKSSSFHIIYNPWTESPEFLFDTKTTGSERQSSWSSQILFLRQTYDLLIEWFFNCVKKWRSWTSIKGFCKIVGINLFYWKKIGGTKISYSYREDHHGIIDEDPVKEKLLHQLLCVIKHFQHVAWTLN